MIRVWSLSNLDSMRHKVVPFKGAWRDAFGQPEQQGCWIIYGKAGQGKTRFALSLARELDEMKYRVLYMTIEEGGSKNFRDAVHDAGIITGVHKINLTPGVELSELDEYLSKKQSPDVIFIDTIQYWNTLYRTTAEQVINLRQKYTNKIFVFISHVDGKEVDGSVAYNVKRDSFLRIQVEGFRAIHAGRGRGGRLGYYTIWDEGAARYWLDSPSKEVNE